MVVKIHSLPGIYFGKLNVDQIVLKIGQPFYNILYGVGNASTYLYTLLFASAR